MNLLEINVFILGFGTLVAMKLLFSRSLRSENVPFWQTRNVMYWSQCPADIRFWPILGKWNWYSRSKYRDFWMGPSVELVSHIKDSFSKQIIMGNFFSRRKTNQGGGSMDVWPKTRLLREFFWQPSLAFCMTIVTFELLCVWLFIRVGKLERGWP